jgi:hypothetical protein
MRGALFSLFISGALLVIASVVISRGAARRD